MIGCAGGKTTRSRSQTLPTEARVRRRPEFLAIQQSGRRFPTRHFLVVHAAPSPRCGRDGDTARLGITVTKKIGSAVLRNRVKRRVREAFRSRRSALAGTGAFVVIARDGSASLSAAEIADELERVFARFASPPCGDTGTATTSSPG